MEESPRFLLVQALADELGLPVLARMEVEAVRYRPVPQRLLNAIFRDHIEPNPIRITPRERQLMVLLSSGLFQAEIAEELGISEYTVKSMLKRLYIKLDARNQIEAVNTFLDMAA